MDLLDSEWFALAGQIDLALKIDDSLGGICSTATFEGATFGMATIAGHDYPAQTLTLTLHN